MPVKSVREATKALKNKGYKPDNENKDDGHRYFYLHIDGNQTEIYTYFSHRNSGGDVQINEIRGMKNQMKLRSIQQVYDFIDCSLTGEVYLNQLREDGYIP